MEPDRTMECDFLSIKYTVFNTFAPWLSCDGYASCLVGSLPDEVALTIIRFAHFTRAGLATTFGASTFSPTCFDTVQ